MKMLSKEGPSTTLQRKYLHRSFIYLFVITCFFLFSLYMLHWPRSLTILDIAPAETPRKQENINQVAKIVTVPIVKEGEEPKTEKVEETKPWYMRGGTRWPKPAPKNNNTGRHTAKIWPRTEEPWDDRITNQLMFVPPDYSGDGKLKKILYYYELPSWHKVKLGREQFIQDQCPVDTCTISVNKAEAPDADAIIFWDNFKEPKHARPPKQVWILLFMESPYLTSHDKYKDHINWTATYRRDSDIGYPYGRWEYYDERVKQKQLDNNYAANKTRKVAWLVSNCKASNGRLEYAHELQKHVSVDIFGKCGSKKFPRQNNSECFQLLDRSYKFYLAFENANCKDYITEKLFRNSLQNNILPIVMGARPEDYAHAAPYHSYIHVDEFESPAELAAYLHRLDNDDDLYNSYFRWKGTGEFIDPRFHCRLCAILNDDFPNKYYRDATDWWRGPGVCTNKPWRETKNQR